jgi:hypothetical protein
VSEVRSASLFFVSCSDSTILTNTTATVTNWFTPPLTTRNRRHTHRNAVKLGVRCLFFPWFSFGPYFHPNIELTDTRGECICNAFAELSL